MTSSICTFSSWRCAVGAEASRSVALALIVSFAFLGAVTPETAAGQYGESGPREVLDFDRPEAWAMKYFTSVSLLTGLGAPAGLEKGSVTVGLESGWIPTLDAAQRKVGFDGTKTEALNRTSLFGRVRVGLGVGGGVTVMAAYVPPIELDGAKPSLLSLSVGKEFVARDVWRISGRAFGQVGSIEGDFTCSASDVVTPSDPAFDCEAPSEDEITQHYLGLELSVSGGDLLGRLEPHASLGVTRQDLEFQVRARYNQIVDQSVFATDGTTIYGTVGAGLSLGASTRLGGEIFYSPLSVEGRNRDPSGAGEPRNTDGLLNFRVLLTHRVR